MRRRRRRRCALPVRSALPAVPKHCRRAVERSAAARTNPERAHVRAMPSCVAMERACDGRARRLRRASPMRRSTRRRATCATRSARQQRIEYKGAVDVVTETDRAVEALVVERLRRRLSRPSDRRRGGRRPASRRRARGRVSTPGTSTRIDGTTNFAHGHPHFAVSLALARDDELLLGVVADPLRGETFAAVRGRGATLNGAPIRVSSGRRARAARCSPPACRTTAASTPTSTSASSRPSCCARRASAAPARPRSTSAISPAAASTRYWEWKLSPWDSAAGVLIVREAGGVVTDFRGGRVRSLRHRDAGLERPRCTTR